LCRQLLARLGVGGGRDDWRIAACVAGPGALDDWGPLLRRTEELLRNPGGTYAESLRGAALFRAGRFAEALPLLEEVVRSNRPGGVRDYRFLAMAHHRLGHAADARSWLAKEAPRKQQTLGDRVWTDRVERQLLQKEAEDVLKGPAGGQPK
jgi:hypothetical protein